MTSPKQQGDTLIDLIKSTCESLIKKLAINKTHTEGKIKAVPINGSEKYTVIINGEEYLIPPRTGVTFNVGDVVIITLYNGDSNRKFIDTKRPKW